MVHPSSGLRWLLLAAAPIGCSDHVLPPSDETATLSWAGAARPFSWPTKLAQQTYTLPKNGLNDALSAQICSLSEKVVDDCFDTSTGGSHAPLLPAAAEAALSVRDTASASKPLNAESERGAPRFAVRWAYEGREATVCAPWSAGSLLPACRHSRAAQGRPRQTYWSPR